MPRYTLIYGNGNIIDEGNNKAMLIAEARKSSLPLTLIDEQCNGIVFENKAQRKLTNA